MGKGFDIGTDYTISDHWDSELATDLSAELGIVNYSKEEKVLTTTEKTNYEQIKTSIELEQEFHDYFSAIAGYKRFHYRDHSEISTSTGKKKTSSADFTASSNSIESKYYLGGRFRSELGHSLTYCYTQSAYKGDVKNLV